MVEDSDCLLKVTLLLLQIRCWVGVVAIGLLGLPLLAWSLHPPNKGVRGKGDCDKTYFLYLGGSFFPSSGGLVSKAVKEKYHMISLISGI